MSLQDRLDKANQMSVSLYLRLTELESQRQQLAANHAQIQAELLRLDGDIRTLTALTAEEKS